MIEAQGAKGFIVSAPHFTAACDLERRVCAPIIRYMCGKSLSWVRAYCDKKGWKFELMF